MQHTLVKEGDNGLPIIWLVELAHHQGKQRIHTVYPGDETQLRCCLRRTVINGFLYSAVCTEPNFLRVY